MKTLLWDSEVIYIILKNDQQALYQYVLMTENTIMGSVTIAEFILMTIPLQIFTFDKYMN